MRALGQAPSQPSAAAAAASKPNPRAVAPLRACHVCHYIIIALHCIALHHHHSSLRAYIHIYIIVSYRY